MSTTATEPDRLREELRQAALAYGRGDLHERYYLRKSAELGVDLCRAVISARLEPGEHIVHEHHVVRSHLKLNQSVLREKTQENISLFLTNRRLFRLTSLVEPTTAATCDDRDQTCIDSIGRGDISGLRVRREYRWGELIAGAVVVTIALAFHRWLLITWIFLLGLGALGMVHALVLPTRWLEVTGGAEDAIVIYAARKKTGRKLVQLLKHNFR
jgi:hypothetical protein